MHRFAQSVFYPAATCMEKVEFRRDPAGTAASFRVAPPNTWECSRFLSGVLNVKCCDIEISAYEPSYS